MYAVIETGGKQYRVQEGDVVTIEKLNVEAGEKVVENGKAKKVIIYKYKSKKDYRKKQGHRQPYTMVKIESLGGKSAPKAAPAAPKAEAKEEAKEKKISASMKKDELIAYAKEHGIEVDEKATKAVIIETIEAAK